jgi:fatty acid desaturase
VRARPVEWQTVLISVAVHGAWLLVVLSHRHTPWWLAATLLALVIAWHGSLQHEVLHGHPFASQKANDALGSVPLGLRLAYPVYRRYHLAHHRCEHLTDPIEDSESYYLDPATWSRLAPPARWLCTAHNTMSGRLILGPMCETVRVYRWQWREIRAGDRDLARWWLGHLVMVCLVLGFVVGVAGFPLWVYLVGVYAGHSLSLVRSFCEHRWVSEAGARTAMVRSGPFWSLLFLNNNLHLTHHQRPDAAWFRLPALAGELGSDGAAATDAGLYRGYWDVFRRYAVKPFDHPVHPRGR